MTQSADLTLDQEKDRMRVRAKARRVAAAQASPRAGEDLARRVLQDLPLPRATVISGFWPLPGEIDLLPLLGALHLSGHQVVLPVMQGAGKSLLFRRWMPGDRLLPGAFGTSEPAPDKPFMTPRVLMVPLLAFDRRGFRLGYGGGFYDRTLSELAARQPVTTVGIAYAGQEFEKVPHDDRDQRLQWIVTEAEVIDTR